MRFENVTFTYPGQKQPAISKVSFCISNGEKIGIVGTNGAGKSTVVKLLCKLYTPQSGKITIDGIDIAKLSAEECWKKTSTLFQDFQMLPVKISENIACKPSKEITQEDIVQIKKLLNNEHLHSWIISLPDQEDTFLSPSLSKKYVTPSGGENQYLAVARAAYKQSSIYIFDEPTMSLDIEVEESVMQMLEMLCKNNTCIMISHRLSHTKFMDRIIVMDKGEIVEIGSHKDLLKNNGLYKEMYAKQAWKYGVKM